MEYQINGRHQETALEVIGHFLKGKTIVDVFGECQSGKTGVHICTAKEFRAIFGQDSLVVAILATQLTTNLDNLRDKFHSQGLQRECVHNINGIAEPNTYKPLARLIRDATLSGKKTLILLDEGHWCLDKKGKLVQFLKAVGFNYQTGKSDGGVYVMTTSATPAPQLICDNHAKVWLPNGHNFRSWKSLGKRIRDVPDDNPITLAGRVKDFVSEVRDRCLTLGNGHVTVRLPMNPAKREIIRRLFTDEMTAQFGEEKKTWKAVVNVGEPNTRNPSEHSIGQLSEALDDYHPPIVPVIHYIKMAGNASETFSLKHMRGAWEGPKTSDKDDTLTQRIGRAQGYIDSNECCEYPIFASKEHWSRMNDVYDLLASGNFERAELLGTYTKNTSSRGSVAITHPVLAFIKAGSPMPTSGNRYAMGTEIGRRVLKSNGWLVEFLSTGKSRTPYSFNNDSDKRIVFSCNPDEDGNPESRWNSEQEQVMRSLNEDFMAGRYTNLIDQNRSYDTFIVDKSVGVWILEFKMHKVASGQKTSHTSNSTFCSGATKKRVIRATV